MGSTVYWAFHGFRAGPTRNTWTWVLRLVPFVLIFVLMCCFPPMRRTADWIECESGRPIPPQDQLAFDRDWYGYIPTYRWIGEVGSEYKGDNVKYQIGFAGRGYCTPSRVYWVIDWWYLGAQFIALTVLFLPFARAKSRLAKLTA